MVSEETIETTAVEDESSAAETEPWGWWPECHGARCDSFRDSSEEQRWWCVAGAHWYGEDPPATKVATQDGALVPLERAALPAQPAAVPDEREWNRMCVMAVAMSKSGAVQKKIQGNPHACLVVLMTARDLGIPLTAARRVIHLMPAEDGSLMPVLSPKGRIGVINQRGLGRVWVCTHGCPCKDVSPPTDQHVRIHGYVRVMDATFTYEFDRADFETITYGSGGKKLVEKDNWKNYPMRMLIARGTGYVSDDLFPEAAFGIYSADELGGVTDEDGNFIDVDSVEMPQGFGSKADEPDPRNDPADAAAVASLRAQIGALPEEARTVLRDLWVKPNEQDDEPRLPPITHLLVRHMTIAEALVASIVKRAEKGEWGDWTPPPSDEVAATEAKPEEESPAEPEPVVPVEELFSIFDALAPEQQEWVEGMMGNSQLEWRDASDPSKATALRALVEAGASYVPRTGPEEAAGGEVAAPGGDSAAEPETEPEKPARASRSRKRS